MYGDGEPVGVCFIFLMRKSAKENSGGKMQRRDALTSGRQ